MFVLCSIVFMDDADTDLITIWGRKPPHLRPPALESLFPSPFLTDEQNWERLGLTTVRMPIEDADGVTSLPEAEPSQMERQAKEKPERAGAKWSDAERSEVVSLFHKGERVISLARKFQRSRGAIRSELGKQGLLPPVRWGSRSNPDTGIATLQSRGAPHPEYAAVRRSADQ
jgi:hypothetical protein